MLSSVIRSTAVLALLAPVAHAQSWDAKALKKKPEAPPAKSKSSASGMTACPEHGAGFYRLDGTTTCVRISGSVDVGVGVSGTRR